MDFHNPYSVHCIDSFAGALLPWHEKSLRSKHKVAPRTLSLGDYCSNRKVYFEEKIYVILIPSRNDMSDYFGDLWWTEEEISISKGNAESELKTSLSSNESFLTLYSAMNLLYRPCSTQSYDIKSKNHFRILVVDKSVESRKMTMYNIAQGYRWAETKELLFLQQVQDYKSAIENISSKEYNVVIINDNLGDNDKYSSFAHSFVSSIKLKSPNCIVIGMSSESLDPQKIKQITNMFMRSGNYLSFFHTILINFLIDSKPSHIFP